MLKTVVVSMFILFWVGFGFSQSQTVPSDGLFMEIKLTNLPVIVGLLQQVDRQSGKIYVALDKEGRKQEEIEIGRIRAVFLLQGNREKLLNYLVGGTLGGMSGLGGLIMKNKLMAEKDNASGGLGLAQLDPKETAGYIAVGTTVGLLVGYLRGRGEEDIRVWPVYDREFVSSSPASSGKRNLQDKENIYRIPAGAMIQVVTGRPGE